MIFFSEMIDNNDPREMFLLDTDWDRFYDFDKISVRKKKEFIEMVFARQRRLVEDTLAGSLRDFFIVWLENTYRHLRLEIIFNLKGKLNFNQFKEYFIKFSE